MHTMSEAELSSMMAFVRATPVPLETILTNVAYLEVVNRALWQRMQSVEAVMPHVVLRGLVPNEQAGEWANAVYR